MIDFRFILQRDLFQLSLEGSFGPGVTGLFGPSGSGKSTLLRLLAGVENPQSGRCILDRKTLFCSRQSIAIPPRERRIGMVFQDHRLFPHFTVRGNLQFGWKLIPPDERKFSFSEMVELLELGDLLEKMPRTLSGGESQRVALGRALLSSPRMLLLDEPLSAMDRGLKNQILPFFRRVMAEIRIPVIYVSHDLGEVLQLTQQLMVVRGGRSLGSGTLLQLINRPEILELTHDLGLLNVLRVKKQRDCEGTGHTKLVLLDSHPSGSADVIWAAPFRQDGQNGPFFVSLRPEDIALVDRPITGISIQNQVPGTLVKILKSSHRVLCLVDVGKTLIVEVTHHALLSLKLSEGQTIWCLFKAQAVRYLS